MFTTTEPISNSSRVQKKVNDGVNFQDVNVALKLHNSFWNQFTQLGCW